MSEKTNYFEKNFYIAIDRDGKIASVPRKEEGYAHWRGFFRLQLKTGAAAEVEITRGSISNIPNLFSKDGFIIICPLELIKGVNSYFIVVFPYEPTKEQLNSLISLYSVLSTVEIGYFEEPSSYVDLNFNKLKIGFENLKKFVQEKKKSIELKEKVENSNKNEGR